MKGDYKISLYHAIVGGEAYLAYEVRIASDSLDAACAEARRRFKAAIDGAARAPEIGIDRVKIKSVVED